MLGADSTSTYGVAGDRHYYNHAQKIFEVGEDASLGIVTWGLGGLSVGSYRMLIARFADRLKPGISVEDAAKQWASDFWNAYTASDIWPLAIECQRLAKMGPYVVGANPPAPNSRDKGEEERFEAYRLGLVAGFCIGGYMMPDRVPSAFVIIADPLGGSSPVPSPITQGWSFWGAPNLIQRLIFGCDDSLKASILSSGKWNGTNDDLNTLVADHQLAHPLVPMREAIDFVHSCIFSTIKAMKFSSLPQICGGPIEIAAITVDRKFRWVRHKPWDTAINEGGLA
ncbi:MAG: hypothetical protein E5Y88_12365 [Mesorhizobium sp.]|uniref:hypothetical protein n=1 Tax=Mesorhizobium sp. TaxID=1871066 RepID=UPI00120F8BFC|nr:hypothetical protein [Mesorhizobium sp.]TIL25735.1 MAG: hypothetical protein E5Y88_12365 [Mesorhizobium sp.]